MQLLEKNKDGLTEDALNLELEQWREPMRKLVEKGLVEVIDELPLLKSTAATASNSACLELNEAQKNSVESVTAASGRFAPFLLEGVTGSGKTEVYLQVIQHQIADDKQALVLIPEIALTPQLISRFQERFTVPVVALHSGLSDRERLNAWLAARDGRAQVVIGTRSAVFTPFKQLGLIVVDEEHDPSFKQQEGFRYSARDVAVRRAQQLNIPIVLGTATPSLETLHNARTDKYHHLVLPERAGNAAHPKVRILDVRGERMQEGLSAPLLDHMRKHLHAGNQVMLFLNRRGFAPTLLCHECGWVSECKRCDSHMTFHLSRNRLRCHHCGSERPLDKTCPQCNGDLIPIGLGTERIEQTLAAMFPETPLVRIDRDTTRRKGALEKKLAEVHQGDAKILLGTQMLAKGHHFPNVTLVGVIDVDQGLFSADFRAIERMAQLVVQVAGRAGRAERSGEVLIQTHQPQHPLLQTLVSEGYGAFAQQALQEREAAHLPPFSYIALLRAEAVNADAAFQFLEEASVMAREYGSRFGLHDVHIQGPVPAPMEKRAGRYRVQLLLQAEKRARLHKLLTPWIRHLEGVKSGRKVRWSLDVDPIDMY
jgi:primosomal protein N' (replication factor Y)